MRSPRTLGPLPFAVQTTVNCYIPTIRPPQVSVQREPAVGRTTQAAKVLHSPRRGPPPPLHTCTASPVSPASPTSTRCTRSRSSLRPLLHTCTRSRSSQLSVPLSAGCTPCYLGALGCTLGLACTVCNSRRVGGSMHWGAAGGHPRSPCRRLCPLAPAALL